MVAETFADGDSLLHRLDPRYKVILAVFFSIVAALADKAPTLFLGVAFSVFLIVLARLNFRQLLVRLLIVNGFIAFLWLFLPFTFGE